MLTLEQKLDNLKNIVGKRKIKIAILGLGSVGNYLLDYLMSSADKDIEIFVVGRNFEKMECDVNIVRVASFIRRQNRTNVKVISGIDFNSVDSLAECLRNIEPDIIVNSSRAYSGLKYGSISWTNVRAYGIWSPLSIKYIKNIMEAYELVNSQAIVINTSYSDAVIPWLKSAGKAYPDFGSGNINHLLPRMKFAVAEEFAIEDYWNIDATYAVAHFHDVVISKEGQDENVEQLIYFEYKGQELKPDIKEVLKKCKIAMPVDAKRNMMNASSNFEIIEAILNVIRGKQKIKLHCPGVFGEIGGYPVVLDSTGSHIHAYIDESHFSLDQMRKKNRESIYLDGIKDVSAGILYYTPELIVKVKKVFGVDLVSQVEFNNIDNVANYIIKNIIEPQLNK